MTTRDLQNRTQIGPESYSESTNLPPLDQLEGTEVRDATGEKIGRVDDSYTDAGGAYVRYLAVTTGWFGTKRHMIPVDDVCVESDGDRTHLAIPYTKDQLRDAPTHERDEGLHPGPRGGHLQPLRPHGLLGRDPGAANHPRPDARDRRG